MKFRLKNSLFRVALLPLVALAATACTDRETALQQKLQQEALVRCNYAQVSSPYIYVADNVRISKEVIRGENYGEPKVTPSGECKPEHRFTGEILIHLEEQRGVDRSATVWLHGVELTAQRSNRPVPSTENWRYMQRHDLYVAPILPRAPRDVGLIVKDIGPGKQTVPVTCHGAGQSGSLFLEGFDTMPRLSYCEARFVVANMNLIVRYDPQYIPFTKDLFNRLDERITSSEERF